MSSWQTGLPDAHEMAPVMHWLGLVVHGAPGLHATQLPALQTPPGHGVPGGRFPVVEHTGAPVLHEMLPVVQALGVHAAPALHGLQLPALQTPPGHVVPFILLLPSMHTGRPELQSMVPFRHAGFGLVVHDPP